MDKRNEKSFIQIEFLAENEGKEVYIKGIGWDQKFRAYGPHTLMDAKNHILKDKHGREFPYFQDNFLLIHKG